MVPGSVAAHVGRRASRKKGVDHRWPRKSIADGICKILESWSMAFWCILRSAWAHC